jgi:transcriptional regulator with XRE-family HTH domain
VTDQHEGMSGGRVRWTPPGAGDRHLQRAFGRGVRAVRNHRGLNRVALAEVIGCHPVWLAGVERGDHNLTLASVERIVRKLEVDAISLLTFK